jgi:hypothetical protein
MLAKKALQHKFLHAKTSAIRCVSYFCGAKFTTFPQPIFNALNLLCQLSN